MTLVGLGDLAETARPVRVDAEPPGQRFGDELPRHDQPDRREPLRQPRPGQRRSAGFS